MDSRRHALDVGKAFILLIGILLASSATAQIETLLQNLACKKDVQSVLDRWDKHRSWRKDLASLGGESVYRTPTAEIGVWLELHRSFTGESRAFRISPEGITEVSWSLPLCRRELAMRPARYDRERMKRAFTDEDFRKAVRGNEAGLVYVWSPHMPLSLKSMDAVTRAAARLHLTVISVLDPAADQGSAEAAVQRKHLSPSVLRRMESIEMFQRGMAIHYPSVLVFAGGKIRGEVIPGAKVEDIYVRLIEHELAKQ